MDNQQPGPSKRIKRVKSDPTSLSRSSLVKSQIRKTFLTKIQLKRSQSVEPFNKILDQFDEQQVKYYSLREFKQLLINAPEARYLLTEKELNDIMDEVQIELFSYEFEIEAEENEIMIEIERHHLYRCVVCEIHDTVKLICKSCCQKYFSEQYHNDNN